MLWEALQVGSPGIWGDGVGHRNQDHSIATPSPQLLEGTQASSGHWDQAAGRRDLQLQ